MLNIAFLLDITGSMSAELDGVKATVARLVQTLFEDLPELRVTIITFTEDSGGCYVTNHGFSDGPEAASFVSGIKLCVPPGTQGINASGGDGPENHKAALVELLSLDPETPTIAFVITDAIPHLLDEPSEESRQEDRFLEAHEIVNKDLFSILARLEMHFEDRLVLSVLKYYDNRDLALYGAVAKRFNGVLIVPQKRTAENLANGLLIILKQLAAGITQTMAETTPDEQNALEAFSFFDLEKLQIPETESMRAIIEKPVAGSRDELLFQLVERTTAIVGKTFGKRAITAHVVSEQVELMLVIAKAFVHAITVDEAMERVTLLLKKIEEMMTDEHRSQFKLSVEYVRRVLGDADIAPTDEEQATASALSLMTVEETAKDVFEEGEDERPDPLARLMTVAKLFLGHMAVLELPMRLGVPDFMDAWGAAIKQVSNDVVSASEFLELIGSEDAVSGLRIRQRDYNFLQIVADPQDAFASEMLRLASGTQLLDILTALLAGAPPGLFSPNMFRGSVSASLMALLSQSELSEFQRAIASKMVHTIRLIMGARPSELDLEPESAMGKLLFRLLRLKGGSEGNIDSSAVRLFLEELAASRAQKFAKYAEKEYLGLIESMVGYEHSGPMLDAFIEDHPLLDATEYAFDATKAVETFRSSKHLKMFEECASNVLNVVYASDPRPSLEEVWPSYVEDMTKLLLLQKRTERYVLTEAMSDATAEAKTKSSPSWVRNEVLSQELSSKLFRVRVLEHLQQRHTAFIKQARDERKDRRREMNWRQAVSTMEAPFDEFLERLGKIRDGTTLAHMLLLLAFKKQGSKLAVEDYESKLQVLFSGRLLDTTTGEYRVVFNRGNLHPHPDRFVPMSDEFKSRLRDLRREHQWPLQHRYRESNKPNHSGHSNDNPSEWAKKQTIESMTFWEMGP